MTLEPFKSSHPKVFENVKPLRKDDFMLDVTSETFLFQSNSRKKIAGRTWPDNRCLMQ